MDQIINAFITTEKSTPLKTLVLLPSTDKLNQIKDIIVMSRAFLWDFDAANDVLG